MLFKYKPRTRFELIKPSNVYSKKIIGKNKTSPMFFKKGEKVWCKNLKEGKGWTKAEVLECLSPMRYLIYVNGIQKKILRKSFDPTNINNSEFVKRYRLTKEVFFSCAKYLKKKSALKASKRVSLELKVICAVSFYATGSYQRIVSMGKYLGQTTVGKYVKEVTDALNSPSVLNRFIRLPLTLAEREMTRQKLIKTKPLSLLNFLNIYHELFHS
ncbi:hypothetical protein ABMA27_014696 [Loxostege sticticalis]|uniref:Uncharacterized protein n=1 Tax=Loxostege sticticalis TaxID=481309 RepID=A0ABR3I9U6_LOXSC